MRKDRFPGQRMPKHIIKGKQGKTSGKLENALKASKAQLHNGRVTYMRIIHVADLGVKQHRRSSVPNSRVNTSHM